MKVLIAGLATETNSFAPLPTGAQAFEEAFLSRDATNQPPNLFSAPLHEWRKASEAKGWDVVESLCAFAQPAGPTVRKVYEKYRDEILADLEKEQPDILLMSMHGAMIAEGYDDCEGDFLTRARAVLGPDKIIGLEIDPHHHLTEEMMEAAARRLHGAHGHICGLERLGPDRAIVGVLNPMPEVKICWADSDRSRFPEKIPAGVETLIAANPADLVTLSPAHAEHLVLTYSHALDLELCHRLLARPFRFLGLIGSATKWARFRSRLAALGHSDAEILRITCPIGDPALGKHPQAIAVGVAAEMLRAKTAETRREGRRA